jgi:hypothetical protein
MAEISTRAFDFARENGIDRIAYMGPGQEVMRNFIAAKVASLRPEMNRERYNAAYSTLSRLGENTQSGQYGTARAMVESSGLAKMNDAIYGAEEYAGSMQTAAQDTFMSILESMDARQQQADEFEKSQPDWLDRTLGVLAVGLSGYTAFK